MKQVTYYARLASKGNTLALQVPIDYREYLDLRRGDMVKVTIQKVKE